MISNHQQSPQFPLSLKSFKLSKLMKMANTYFAVNQDSFSSRNGGFRCFKTCQFTTVWTIILYNYHGWFINQIILNPNIFIVVIFRLCNILK